MLTEQLFMSILLTLLSLAIYQIATYAQQKWQSILLNPMLVTISVLVPLLVFNSIDYHKYMQATQLLNAMLEPAIVALGFPLYLQLKNIKYHWKEIIAILSLGIIVVIIISFISTMALIAIPEVAVALSLKSVTTPIGIALTEQHAGDSSITAFAILIAGFCGALLGPRWLSFIGVNSVKAQGLAVGSTSHAIGTAVLAKISPEHAAYSSVALILSALLTALISPWLIPLLQQLFT
jgi:putative effector of murein hydrolase